MAGSRRAGRGGRRSASSARWLAEHESDPWVQRARSEGWRSRAVFKLAEIDARDRLLRPGMRIVDLGAAPGGWMQYVLRRTSGQVRLIGLDLLPIEPLAGAEFLQGDFRSEAVLHGLQALLGDNRGLDLVLSDMAPNMRGVRAADQPAAMLLAELAADFAAAHLERGGTLLVKAFQGEGFDALLARLRGEYERVALRKPRASRPRSPEVYLLARGFGGRG